MNWKPDSDIPEAQSSTQVFEKLCGKLACFSPLVRESEATKLVRVWNYFSKQILGDRHDNQFVRNGIIIYFLPFLDNYFRFTIIHDFKGIIKSINIFCLFKFFRIFTTN
uniref:Maturase K n=1 Tax=Panagrolaimus superbus TaxID=310955 RepID=A0A914YLW0_9BILA